MPLGNEEYFELATAGTYKIVASNKQIEILDMLITNDTAGASLTITDTNDHATSRKLYLRQGFNDLCEWAINFVNGKDVVFTATGGNLSVFVRFARK